jgi:Ca2+-binding RTX toxin-like protein
MTMTTVNPLFDNADLSLASYAVLPEIVPPAMASTSSHQLELTQAGMTDTQATMFANRWPDIVASHTDTTTGLSVTVFRNGSDVCVTIRGTTPTDFNDLWADLQLGTGDIVDQYDVLKTYFDALKTSGVITGADNVVVAGHSLGGFLAQVLTVDRAGDIDHTYTYNAPGIGGVSLDIFGSTGSVPVSSITNIQGDGFSTIANVGISVGLDKEVEIENSLIALGDHTIKKLTDSLAVYDTLWQLDNSLSIGTFNSLFKQSSNSEDASLEGIVDALQKMFGISNTPLEIDDRDEFYSAVYAVRDTDAYGALVNNASVNSSTEINAQQASTDFGAFLALHYLSPVYISGAALAEPNSSLYSQWSGGEFSSQYLEDRAAMLHTILNANSNDIDYDDVRGVYFSDAETDAIVGVTSDGFLAPDNKKTVFGSESSDNLSGGNNNDHLYGAGGNDTLVGAAGDDYLEGGSGDDVLNAGTGFDRLNGGAGNDVYQIDLNNFGDAIISGDTDGGTISLLSGITFRKAGSGEANANGLYIAVDDNGDWQSGKEGWSVSVSGSTATVIVKDSSGNAHTIAIENFNASSNHFGIQLQQSAEIDVPAQGGAFTVGDGYLGSYTPSGSETSADIYLPNNRNGVKDEAAAAANPDLDIEAYRNKSLTYNAVDYWGEWNANDLHWEPSETGGSGYPGHEDEVLVIDTAASRHGAADMYFEGSNKNDALYGKDWTSQMQAIKAWDDANNHIFHLNNINNFDPAVNGNNDILFGLDGDDLLIGDGNQSVLTQQPGSQTGNSDALIGGRGSDAIYGMGGNDWIAGMEEYRAWGAASLGLTYDPAKYNSLSEAVFKNAFLYDPKTQQETQTVIVLEENDEKNYLDGGDGNDAIEGAGFDDVIDGGNGSDWIYGGAGRDIIAGGAGNDEISGDSYAYFVDGVARGDFIAPDAMPDADDYSRAYFYKKDGDGVALRYDFDKDTDYNDVIDGGAGDDFIQGEIGSDNISGGTGNDTLFGDRVYGAGHFIGTALPPANFQSLSKTFHGDDVMDGGDGNDLMVGGGGSDRLLGGSGDDTIYGDVGLDKIEFGANTTGTAPIRASDDGWWGADVLIGGAGSDTLVGEGNDDTLDGSDGDDFLYGDWANWQTQAFADTNGKTGNDTLYGGAGNDQLMGNSGDDTLVGGSGNDKLFGDSASGAVLSGAGDDVLDGGEGDDYLTGGAGEDTLRGGVGNDVLNGGEGDDVYTIFAGDGQDSIEDSAGRNTLQVGAGQVDIETVGDTSTLYLSADHSQSVVLTGGSLASFNIRNINGERINQHQQIVAQENTGTTPVYSINTDMGGTVDVEVEGESGIALQLTGARPDFAPQAAVTVSDAGAQVTLTQTDGTALTITLNSWDELATMTDKFGLALGFALDATAEVDGVLNGRGGNDVLIGGEGDETLCGYAGDDHITGGAGNDVLRGGAGDDVYSVGDNDGIDVLADTEGSSTLVLTALHGADAALDLRVDASGMSVFTSASHDKGILIDDASWQLVSACKTAEGDAVSQYRYYIEADTNVVLAQRFAGATAVVVLPEGSSLDDFSASRSLSHPQDLLLQSTTDDTFIRVADFFADGSQWQIASGTEADMSLVDWASSHWSESSAADQFSAEQATALQQMGEHGESLGSLQDVTVGGVYDGYAKVESYTFAGVTGETIVLDGNPLAVDASESDTVTFTEKTHVIATEVPVYRDFYTAGGVYTLSGNDDSLGSIKASGYWSVQENPDGTVTVMQPSHSERVQVGTETRFETVTETVADVTRQFTQYQIVGGAADDAVTATGPFVGTVDVGDGNNVVQLGGDHQSLWRTPVGSLPTLGADLAAGTGDDTLIGTRGSDVIRAGSGINTVVGGAGDDVYYVSLADGSQTTITDAAGEGVYNWQTKEDANAVRSDGNDWLGYYAPINNTVVFTDAFDLSSVTYSVEQIDTEENENFIHFDATRRYADYGNPDWRTNINTKVTLHIGTAEVSVWVGEDWARDGDSDDTLRIQAGVQTVVLADGSSMTWDTLLANIDDAQNSETNITTYDKIITQTYNSNNSQYIALNAGNLLSDTVSEQEKSRWQIIQAEPVTDNFSRDIFDLNGNGSTSGSSFIFVENLWNSGINYLGFLPSETATDASFSYTLQRDDGLTLSNTVQVHIQTPADTLFGTDSAEILDGGQSVTPLYIDAGAGNDRITDGYGNDIVLGNAGNDTLTFGNWRGNGDDVFDGGAGDDVLDAGWGVDTLIGGEGNDLYIEGNLWSGDHTTIDNNAMDDGTDTLQIGSEGYGMWDYRSLWFSRDGSDLLIDQIDELADGDIRIKDWYANFDENNDGLLNDAGGGRLDSIRVQQDDGAVFIADTNSSQFDALINAMAQFDAKPASVSDVANVLQDKYQTTWMQLAMPDAA